MAKLSLANNPDKASMINTGSKQFAKMKMIDSIQTAEPFRTLFPIKQDLLETIVEDIKQNGYDSSQPLILWKEQGVLLDGHTRLAASKQAGILQVPVVEHSFASVDQAKLYSLHLQVDRRNLSDNELYAFVIALDSRRQRGRKKSSSDLFSEQQDENTGKSSREVTAEKAGTSPAKVQKIRAINEKADPDIKEKGASGDYTINKAYNEVKKASSKRPVLPKKAKPKAETVRPPLLLSETLAQSIETIKQNSYQRRKALEQIVADLNYRQHITEAEMKELLEIVRK